MESDWSQTSELLAMAYNMNRAPKTKAIPSSRFNPFGRRSPRRRTARLSKETSWAMFREAFDAGAFGGKRR